MAKSNESSDVDVEELDKARSHIIVEIIDGTADVVIVGKKYKLKLGEGIIIPAHAIHFFNAEQRFKMISTVIKSGYED